jgi:predicted amidohydrolase
VPLAEQAGLGKRGRQAGEARESAEEAVSDPGRTIAAVVQMTSTANVEKNLAAAEALVERAVARGATFVGLPENFAFLRAEGEPVPEPQALDGPWVSRMAGLARRLKITLLLGSLPERVPGDRKVRNTSVLLGPDGSTLAVYRKMHLFDIDLPGMEHLKESRAVLAGEEPVVAQSPFGPIGLSICYDVRFPELYRELARRGARVLAVPSAFTERTGKAHWEVLLRARAIENLAYVIAPAQVGHHGGGRASHGQALIVDPWGSVLAQVPDGEGVALAELDFERQDRLRRELPALQHRRLG